MNKLIKVVVLVISVVMLTACVTLPPGHTPSDPFGVGADHTPSK